MSKWGSAKGMWISSSGRLGLRAYGFAAIVLGVTGLVFGDFATVWQPVQPGVPFRHLFVYSAAVCFLLAGTAVQWARAEKAALCVLGALYLIFAMLWLPRVVGFPGMIGTWLGFAEELALAVAVVAWWRLPAGRVLFGLCVVVFGLAHWMALKETAAMVPGWILPGQRFWGIATGVGHFLAGLAIALGIQVALASRLLAAMLLSFLLFVWAPMLAAHPNQQTMWAGSAITLAMAAAALMAGRER